MNLRPFVFIAAILSAVTIGSAQSRNNARSGDIEGAVVPVFAYRAGGDKKQIKVDDLFLYENGIEQKIRNFSYDPSPSRIVILVDNSQTLPTSVESLKNAVMEFAYEIFEGDQLFVVAYDEKPEIIQEWTDDAKKLETSLSTLRKRGNPYLFDALTSSLNEVLLPLMPGTRKTAIVIVGDGLDRGSKRPFDRTLADLQGSNVTVYSLQLPDRTGGAYRRDQPKAPVVLSRLAESTGGRVFQFDEAQAAAKAICDELRNNRYLLSYIPTNTSSYDERRLFLIGSEGITIRTKTAQPPNLK